jgi:hypothetical protein
MPYEIRKDGSESDKPYCVYGKDNGHLHGCYGSEEEAKKRVQEMGFFSHQKGMGGETAPASGMQVRAWNGQYCCFAENSDSPMPGSCHDTEAACQGWMEARASKKTTDDAGMYVIAGGAVKALGNGRVGGYLVTYGGEGDRSEFRDIFGPDTDYHVEFPHSLGVYYFHGGTKAYGKKKLGKGTCKAESPEGLYIEGFVGDREVYAAAERGELAWSSGAVAHLVEREALPGGAHKVTSWPLGEASLAPVDAVADARNTAIALKTLLTDDPDAALQRARCRCSGDVKTSLAESTERWLDDGEEMLTRYRQLRTAEAKAGRILSASRMERLQRALSLLTEILTEATPREAEAATESPETGPEETTPDLGLARELTRLRAQALTVSEA